MKKVLILGTGNAQVDIIKYFTDQGIEVHGCSYKHGDNAEKFLDHFHLLNIIDIYAVKKCAVDNKIDLIYSAGSDLAMPTLTKVNEELNLPCFISSKTAEICNNKFFLRQYLGNSFEGNIPFQVISKIEDSVLLKYPFMLKPVDSQGQRGCYKISNELEYKKYIEVSMGYSRSKKAIIEEFIDGDEISVNTYSVNGKCIFKLISDRIVWDNLPGGIIHKHIIPSKYDKGEMKEKIETLVDNVLEKLNIKNGPAYFQIKIQENKKPILLEVTPRLDGCHMWKLIKFYCNIDLLDLTCRHLLDEKLGIENIEIDPKYSKVVLEFMCQKPNSIVRKSMHNTKNAELVIWYYNDGDKVKAMNGYMEKCGYCIYDDSEEMD